MPTRTWFVNKIAEIGTIKADQCDGVRSESRRAGLSLRGDSHALTPRF